MAEIEQKIIFHATPSEVYELLMDSRRHSAFTGDKASISREVGGKIKAYGDYIEGINMELIDSKRIVQRWRASDWPKGQYSVIRIELIRKGRETELHFKQTNLPEGQKEEIAEGWYEYYWDKMKKYFGE